MLAGFQTVNITPPIGFSLSGFVERDHGSEGIRDDLYARAMVIGNGRAKVSIVTSDLGGVSLELTNYIREKVSRLTDIPAGNIMITGSHTHSGPQIRRRSGLLNAPEPQQSEQEKAYTLNLCECIAGAIIAANAKLSPVLLGVGVGHLRGLGANRRDPNGYFDDRVTVLKIIDPTGEIRGALVNYTCHPTILDYRNYLISGDYPSYTQQALETLYPNCTPMFLQGAAGDVSTRHTRRSSTFEEAKRMGHLLAGTVVRILSEVACAEEDVIGTVIENIDLPRREYPDEKTSLARLEEARENYKRLQESGAATNVLRTAEVVLEGAQRVLDGRRLIGSGPLISTQMQTVRIGPLVIVGVPAELFNSIGKEIKDSTDKATVVIGGYCNDSIGYVLTPDVYGESGYEAGATITGPGAAAVIREMGGKMVTTVVKSN